MSSCHLWFLPVQTIPGVKICTSCLHGLILKVAAQLPLYFYLLSIALLFHFRPEMQKKGLHRTNKSQVKRFHANRELKYWPKATKRVIFEITESFISWKDAVFWQSSNTKLLSVQHLSASTLCWAATGAVNKQHSLSQSFKLQAVFSVACSLQFQKTMRLLENTVAQKNK